MADNAMPNWHAVRRFYGQASTQPLDGCERACGFHWRQSLFDQTKKHITLPFREAHVRMCTAWFDSKIIEEAKVQFAIFRGWWTSSGAADPSHHKELHSWLGWWHFRYPHLGRYMKEVNSVFFMVYLPSATYVQPLLQPRLAIQASLLWYMLRANHSLILPGSV